jgi:hypothetical protein
VEGGGDAADDGGGFVGGGREGRDEADVRLVREELVEECRA